MDIRDRYRPMLWNTPLSEQHASVLLGELDPHDGQRIVDLGCGWGELLLRALELAGPRTHGVGIETEPAHLDRARELAESRDLGAQLEFHTGDANKWSGTADRALCIGSTHAYGGFASTLQACARILPADGRVLIGEGYWLRPPTPQAREIFGEELGTLEELLARCRSAGWRILHSSTADQHEWDEFEAASMRGPEQWCASNPGDHTEVREWITERKRSYREVYRGVLGFAYLVLVPENVGQDPTPEKQ
ncbi:SAM-dependent methyltransferase [Sciscionella marina]|uniref:SAM-dependent methyltransferase n=1 Tax=Sciscionella marina TaxID=508770 RepID=UPI00037DC8CC|nr:class I SAM-dependent methyltransferase [Sciscionella marina]